MKVTKSGDLCCSPGERLYPVADTVQKAMLPVVDIDGLEKPVLQIIIEEAFASGIEEICVVCAPGDGARYIDAFTTLRNNLVQSFKRVDWAQKGAEQIDRLLDRTQFVEQKEPKGYGHAVYCARDFVNGEPFLLLLGDYLYVSHLMQKRCAAQLIDLAVQEDCSVSAVQATIEHQVTRYGTLTGKQLPARPGVYQIEKIIEKPSLSEAELELQTSGLRAGYYLCFFGMHVFTPSVFTLLEEHIAREKDKTLLTPALQELAAREPYLALEVKGSRYDLSRKHGLLRAQIALGLAGEAHSETLMTLVEALAEAKTIDNRQQAISK